LIYFPCYFHVLTKVGYWKLFIWSMGAWGSSFTNWCPQENFNISEKTRNESSNIPKCFPQFIFPFNEIFMVYSCYTHADYFICIQFLPLPQVNWSKFITVLCDRHTCVLLSYLCVYTDSIMCWKIQNMKVSCFWMLGANFHIICYCNLSTS
jgi:hypothetical protein